MPIFSGNINEPKPSRQVKAMERYLAAQGMTMQEWLALDNPKPRRKPRRALSSWERFMRALVALPDLRP